jgi:hypothetical protein
VDQLTIEALELVKFVNDNAKKENKDLLETTDLLEKIVKQDKYLDKDGTCIMVDGSAANTIHVDDSGSN